MRKYLPQNCFRDLLTRKLTMIDSFRYVEKIIMALERFFKPRVSSPLIQNLKLLNFLSEKSVINIKNRSNFLQMSSLLFSTSPKLFIQSRAKSDFRELFSVCIAVLDHFQKSCCKKVESNINAVLLNKMLILTYLLNSRS